MAELLPQKSGITVVIPLYNKAEYITRTLQSVVEQAASAEQIIVVDDGSSDSSVERVREFMRLHAEHSIILIEQPNQGPSSARNCGVQNATTEWVALLDADDYWLPHHLTQCIQAIEEVPDCSVFASAYFFDYASYQTQARLKQTQSGLLHNYFDACCFADLPLTSSSVVIKRETYLAHGGMNTYMRLGEDQCLWSRLAVTSKIYFSAEPSVVYWIGDRNLDGLHHRILEPPPHLETYRSLIDILEKGTELYNSLFFLSFLTVLNCVKQNALMGNRAIMYNLLRSHWAIKPYRYHVLTFAGFAMLLLPKMMIKRLL